MENSSPENAVNADLKEVHRMVEVVKTDSGITISCVRLMEKLSRSEKEAEARGEARGRAKGKKEELVARVCKKRKLGQSLEKLRKIW